MKNHPIAADEKRLNEPVFNEELRPFCACRQEGSQFQCTHFSTCHFWSRLQERTAKNSWLDRFLRAFVATRVQGRVFAEDSLQSQAYSSVLFTPFEGKNLMKDLTRMIYSLHEKYSHPMALYVEGYKMREIADILEISIVTVLMRIALARRKLLSLLEKHPIVSLKISGENPEKQEVK